MTALPGAADPVVNRIRRRRRRRGVFGPIRQGGIGFNQQNPFGGLLPGDPEQLQALQEQFRQAQTNEERQRLAGVLGGEAQDIQRRNQAQGSLLPVLTQFARAGIPLPGPISAIGGLPSFTGPGPEQVSNPGIVRGSPRPVTATGDPTGDQIKTSPLESNFGGPEGGLPLGRNNRPLPNDLDNKVGFVQPVNGTGLTVGGPATAASLARLAPAQPLNNPLRNVNPA